MTLDAVRTGAAPGSLHGPQGLLLLLVVDAFFACAHVVWALTHGSDPAWSIEQDRGYAEWFQYAKEFACLLLLAFMARWPALRGTGLAWSMVLAWILVDDSFSLHEQAAAWWVEGRPAPAPPLYIAELLFMGLVSALLLPGVVVAWQQGQAVARQLAIRIGLALSLFVVFAVGVDLLHALVTHRIGHPLLGLAEEAGEMASLSLLLWVLVRYGRRSGFESAKMGA